MINAAAILSLINTSRRTVASSANNKKVNKDILEGRGLKPLGSENIMVPMPPVKPSIKHNISIKMTYDNVWHIYVNNKLTFSTISKKNLMKYLLKIINNKN